MAVLSVLRERSQPGQNQAGSGLPRIHERAEGAMGALSGRAVALLVLLLLGAGPLAAQGVTTASIRGTVLGTDGTPIEVATIQITNVSTGARWQVTSSAGRYFVDG